MPISMDQARILIVDDNEALRSSLKAALESESFHVTTAASVGQALRVIREGAFDVLLCDLHLPSTGDGYSVVSAMRHLHSRAVTLVFTDYPELKQAMNASLLQADEVLVKPMAEAEIVSLIHKKLRMRDRRQPSNVERVASILERASTATIAQWLIRVDADPELTQVPLNDEQRTGHLPKLLESIVLRLRNPRNLGTKSVSAAAELHGAVRQSQGYSVPMLVEESRILQVTLFETLQNNLSSVDFSLLLLDIMTIADEVDSQLKQTISTFLAASERIKAA